MEVENLEVEQHIRVKSELGVKNNEDMSFCNSVCIFR